MPHRVGRATWPKSWSSHVSLVCVSCTVVSVCEKQSTDAGQRGVIHWPTTSKPGRVEVACPYGDEYTYSGPAGSARAWRECLRTTQFGLAWSATINTTLCARDPVTEELLRLNSVRLYFSTLLDCCQSAHTGNTATGPFSCRWWVLDRDHSTV